jgi:Uma2 family endonuclease
MISAATKRRRAARRGAEPAWDIALLFPDQGSWDEWDYLSLDTNHLVEFTDGSIRVLPMPRPAHQRIVKYLVRALEAHVGDSDLGEVFFAPMPVRLRKGKYREPDVILVLAEHADRVREDYCDGADLVIEVVSPDPGSRARDWVEKRRDYAAAGIREYWIVDPQEKTIVVLTLRGKRYVVRGQFSPGQLTASALLPRLSVDVRAVLTAAGRR